MDGKTSDALPWGLSAGVTLVEGLVIVAVILILAALLVPTFTASAARTNIDVNCTTNLKIIGTLTEMYRRSTSAFVPPDGLGAQWHQQLMSMGADGMFQCPYEGSAETCPDYRGPSRRPEGMKGDDFIAGDKLGNHGKEGVNAITKNYSVMKISPDDRVRWEKYQEDTRE